MSGHSKWASIRHKKAAVDAKRSNIFTKLANDITVAARRGGGDVNFNPLLRTAVETARKANMPKDNVERAIKRGTGELGGAIVEEMLYEGFGPANVAILVAAVTDNRNRTTPLIRTLFTKNGGRFADGGGVAYQFTQFGVIRLEIPQAKEDAFEEAVIEADIEDYKLGDGHATVYTKVPALHTVQEALEQAGFSVESADIEWVANTPIEVGDAELEQIANFVSLIEDNEDVTNVFTNLAE